MPDLKAFYQPRTLAEAIALLEEHGEHARPLAGGTSLSISKSPRVEVLVDLRHLGIDHLEPQEQQLHVGAMVTCTALRRHLATWRPGVLGDAVEQIASRVLQNQITVGGNCVMVFSWSDLPVALWCLDARFVVQRSLRRELSADAFFAEHPTHVLAEGELLAEVIVPRPQPGEGSAYVKLARNATDQSLASAAALLRVVDGTIQRARLAVGAVRGLPQLLAGAARHLEGKPPTPALFAEAAAMATSEAKITGDYKASAEYRQQLVSSLIEDGLELALRRAGGAA
jgi:aerobic carbon-monoxide dehydrogenase medium subunit